MNSFTSIFDRCGEVALLWNRGAASVVRSIAKGSGGRHCPGQGRVSLPEVLNFRGGEAVMAVPILILV